MPIDPNATITNTGTGASISVPPVKEIRYGSISAAGTTSMPYPLILGAELQRATGGAPLPGAIPIGQDGTGGTWQADWTLTLADIGCSYWLNLTCENAADSKSWEVHIVDLPGDCTKNAQKQP